MFIEIDTTCARLFWYKLAQSHRSSYIIMMDNIICGHMKSILFKNILDSKNILDMRCG